MKVMVLLSAGRHPVSDRPCLPRVEAQAVAMALRFAAPSEIVGLHAGTGVVEVSEALGFGLARVDVIESADPDDPIPALAAAVRQAGPKLVLAGRRGQGGADSGMVPYMLAHALGMAILPDVISIAPGEAEDTIVVEQALLRGARRRIVARLPAIVTVHPASAAPTPFAFGRARQGVLLRQRLDLGGRDGAVREGFEAEERTYQRRPRVMARAAAGASAADRLRAATEVAGGGGGKVMVDPSPEEAARAILAYLRGIDVLRT